MKYKPTKCMNCGKEEVMSRGLCGSCYAQARRGKIDFPIDSICDRTKTIIEDCKNGMSIKDIVTKNDCSKSWVYAVIDKYIPNYQYKYGPRDKELKKDKVIKLIKEGEHSMTSIARKVGCSYAYVYVVCQKYLKSHSEDS